MKRIHRKGQMEMIKDGFKKRGSGILLHITSLPSPYGIGDFGEWAYRFVDFLAETKQSYWQMLPLNPTAPILGNSPYSSFSVFAGNHNLICPELLVKDGFLSKSDIENHPPFPANKVDYQAVGNYKEKILALAYEKVRENINHHKAFNKFCHENAHWLDDFALFISLKEHFNGIVWREWPRELRDREKAAIDMWREKLKDTIVKEEFFQYLFFKQWSALKQYSHSKGIKIIGDIPIYVSYDSCDVWRSPQIFKLDDQKKPTHVAGVPPDYFSSTGQLWGNPVYRWDILKKNHYAWWMNRMEHMLKLFDVIRIDHFRGFVAFWEVPTSEKTAVHGRWVKAPVKDFFTKVLKKFPHLPIIAEDLGYITDDVREVMHHFQFPGMKLLLFAFDDNPVKNPYIPHNHIKNCVLYTGTHDNNTVKGWFEKEARPEDRNKVLRYLGRDVAPNEIAWELVKLAMMSVANTAILPIQDILGLGTEARMNYPSTVGHNWEWRLLPDMLSPGITSQLREITEVYGRA